VSGAIIDQPSFQFVAALTEQTNLTTIPFGRYKFLWTDTASGFQVDSDWAFLPGSFAAFDFAYLCGPARADSLTITLDHLDPAQVMLVDWGLTQSSHVYPEFRVQETGQPAVIGLTRAGQGNPTALLASVGAVVPAGGMVTRLASAWAGDAFLSCDNTNGTAAITVQVLDPGVVLGGGLFYGTVASGILASMYVPAGQSDVKEVALPNGSVLIREVNGSATVAQTPTTTVIRRRG